MKLPKNFILAKIIGYMEQKGVLPTFVSSWNMHYYHGKELKNYF